MSKNTLWIVLIVIVVLGLGGWWYMSMQQTPEPAPTTGEVQGENDEQFVDDSKDGAPAPVTVTYGANGFSPSTVTVKKGTTVTFVNQGTEEMWIGSDEHPSHTGYDGTNKDSHCAEGYTGAKPFDQCGVTTSYSFTFTKAGTFAYHNHREDDDRGTVVVTE